MSPEDLHQRILKDSLGPFNGHFPDEPGLAGVYCHHHPHHQRMMEVVVVVVTTVAISRAKLQSNHHHHHQQTNIRLFYNNLQKIGPSKH